MNNMLSNSPSTNHSVSISIIILLAFGSSLFLTFLASYEPKFALIALIGVAFFVFLTAAPLFWLGAFLLAFIPFHGLISQLLGGYSSNVRQVFVLWKEALIIVGLARAFFGNTSRWDIIRSNHWLLLTISCLVIIYVISILRFPSVPSIFAFNLELRFIGILLFFMLLPLNHKQLNLLMVVMLVGISLTAFYGIIQYFWDYERLFHLLYYNPGVFTEVNRRIYSFTLNVFDPAYGPVIGILIVVPRCVRRPSMWFWGMPLVGLLVVCLGLTYSRSGWLALIAGVVILIIFDRQYFRSYAISSCLVACLTVTVLLFASNSIYDSLLGHRISTMVSQKDPSSLTHKSRMRVAVDTILKNPSGIGLAKVGNIQARFQGGVEKGIYTENWVLQVGVQTGLIGALIYIILIILLFISLLRKLTNTPDEKRLFRISAAAALAAMMVAGILIPVWDFLLPVIYTWSLIGIALRTL